MYFSTFALAVLAAGTSSVLADRCTFIGWETTTQNFGGASNGPVFGSAGAPDTGFQLYYVGGKKIASTEGNSIKIGGVTVKGSDLKLPKDVEWRPDSGFLTIQGCSIKYDGKEYKGYTKGPIRPCETGGKGLGVTNCSYCSADFDCPGGL